MSVFQICFALWWNAAWWSARRKSWSKPAYWVRFFYYEKTRNPTKDGIGLQLGPMTFKMMARG